MSITKQQIEQVLIDNFNSEKTYNDEYIQYGLSEIKSDLTFKQVQQVGGENQGSTFFIVYEVTNANNDKVHIKFDGYYSSYNGSEFDNGLDFTMVEPFMREVRDWRKV